MNSDLLFIFIKKIIISIIHISVVLSEVYIQLGWASLNSPRLVLDVEGTFQAGGQGFKLAAPSCIINVYIVYCLFSRYDVKIRTVILLYYSPTKKCENNACDFFI